MPTIDDLARLIDRPLDERAIRALLGAAGEALRNDLDPGHPEDARRYYIVPSRGLQLRLDDAGVVDTVFCLIDGDPDVAGYPWSFANGIGGASDRAAARAAFGPPARSGDAGRGGFAARFAPGGWDQFDHPTLGPVHVQYKATGPGISRVTLMRRPPE